jgi:hypothetical protein
MCGKAIHSMRGGMPRLRLEQPDECFFVAELNPHGGMWRILAPGTGTGEGAGQAQDNVTGIAHARHPALLFLSVLKILG